MGCCHTLVLLAPRRWVLRLSYEVLFVSVIGLKNLEKGWKVEATKFVFVFIEAKIRQKTHWIFQICKICDQENMKIGKLSFSYQISPSQDSKNKFLLVRISFNHENFFVWNASIWGRGPCTYQPGKKPV